jgi:hypothetical protein
MDDKHGTAHRCVQLPTGMTQSVPPLRAARGGHPPLEVGVVGLELDRVGPSCPISLSYKEGIVEEPMGPPSGWPPAPRGREG